MQGLFLLHSEYVPASRDLLALWQAADPVPGEVVTGHAAAVALMPQFQGYPAAVYEDATGRRHCLFNPPTIEAITAWRDGIDNPPKATTMSRYAFSQRFTSDEMLAILSAQPTDVAIQLFVKLLDYALDVDLTDVNIKSALDHLVAKGILTTSRETAILTP